jgi:hypothetical protein
VGALRVEHTKDRTGEIGGLPARACPTRAGRLYSRAPWHGLLITAQFLAGLALYPVNPKTIDRKRSASRAKSDQIDAYLLSKHGRTEWKDLRRLDLDSPKVAELKTLARDEDSLIQRQTRLVNQLNACLKGYYPVALTLWSSLQQKTTLVFLLTYPTPAAAQAATVEQLGAVLKQAGHPAPQKVAPTLFEYLRQPRLRADEVTVRTKSRLMLALVAQLGPLVEQIADYDKEMSACYLTHEDNEVFSPLPGADKRLAPRLLAERGDDRNRYVDAASVQALASTAPVLFESGNYARVHQRFACFKPLRNALHQIAWQRTRAVKRGPRATMTAKVGRGKATI